jgi:hypothetical protein
LNYPDATSVIAKYGPFANQRWTSLGGDNETVPSSGAFVLNNVVPSTLDPSSPGYRVGMGMYFRANRRFQTFTAPLLGSGVNPPVTVAAGSTVDLANTFRIQPGFLRGNILLRGPAELGGQPSVLRGIRHCGDEDLDGDGIPDRAGTYGVYYSAISAHGVDRQVSGATYSASGGYATTDFESEFDPATASVRGSYELALGGLNSERTSWRQHSLSLVMESGADVAGSNFYWNSYFITDGRSLEHEIAPDHVTTKDVAYCFGEVELRFVSREGTFHSPQVRFSRGGFVGTDFQRNPADYSVYLDIAHGTPLTASTATNEGQLRLLLPQGTYTLYPQIQSPEGATIYLPEITNVVVGCGTHSVLSPPCLQMNLAIPFCSRTRLLSLDGIVNSCTNVLEVTSQIDDQPRQTVCADCGVNPVLNFTLPVDGACDDHTVTIRAVDASGAVASQSGTVHFDDAPPTLNCPTNVFAACTAPEGTTVNYPPISASDNCPGPVTVVCTPPSGSLFSQGATLVSCNASDACGNEARCQFTVNVGPSRATIEAAICVRWVCGTLQQAPDVTGPWEDVPGAASPYYAPVSDPRRFYRIR